MTKNIAIFASGNGSNTENISVVGVDIGGAATFLEFAAESDIQLFI